MNVDYKKILECNELDKVRTELDNAVILFKTSNSNHEKIFLQNEIELKILILENHNKELRKTMLIPLK